MPSYSQYKRQMATIDADDANIETWITVKGNHIPIMKGQSKEEAVQAFIEKKGGKTDLTTKKGPKGETLFASKKELKNASLSNLGKDPKGIKPAILESGEKPASKERITPYSDRKAFVKNAIKQYKKNVEAGNTNEAERYKRIINMWGTKEENPFRKSTQPKTVKQLKKAASNLESDPAYHYERADRLSDMIKQREKELENPNISQAMKNTIERGIGELQLAISKHWDAAGKLEKAAREKAKPANKGWQNARSSHPETIGKVVRRVVKKIGEARNKNND